MTAVVYVRVFPIMQSFTLNSTSRELNMTQPHVKSIDKKGKVLVNKYFIYSAALILHCLQTFLSQVPESKQHWAVKNIVIKETALTQKIFKVS